MQFKRSLEPGDSKDMVLARQAFLNGGFYQPIADLLNELVLKMVGSESFTVLDAGCGEGYYTARLADALAASALTGAFAVAGIDISKPAIQAACGRNSNITWLVGTNARMPVQDHTVDVVLCLFGFPVWDEFHRVLKPGGRVIMVDPATEHLIEMRRVLYAEVKDKTAVPKAVDGFVLEAEERLQQVVPPPPPALRRAQIMMTPHGFRATEEAIEKASQAVYDGMTIDVMFSVYRVI